MTDAPITYRIVSRVHVNEWVNELQQAVPGWRIHAYWVATATTLPVFVPDVNYTPENVDEFIRLAGEKDERIHALGG